MKAQLTVEQTGGGLTLSSLDTIEHSDRRDRDVQGFVLHGVSRDPRNISTVEFSPVYLTVTDDGETVLEGDFYVAQTEILTGVRYPTMTAELPNQRGYDITVTPNTDDDHLGVTTLKEEIL